MFLFMMIAACFGVLQLALLGSVTRSVRMANLLLAVSVGLYGCGAVAVILQLLYTRGVALLTGESVSEVVRTASYSMDPVIEEVVKVLPLLALVAFRRIRAQWGLTDFALLGAAAGAGFGLVEATMRWSHQASSAVGGPIDGWTIPLGFFGGVYVPGPFQIAGSWLPAPVVDAGAFIATGSMGVNLHLVWSMLAGFGVGLLVRGRGWQRWLGLLPWLYAALDHMAYNHDIARPGENAGIWFFSAPVRAIENVHWLLPVVVLVVAGALDWRRIRAGKAALPDVLLAAERSGRPGIAALGRFATVGLPWTPILAMRFALLRRSLMYAYDPAALDQLHVQVRSAREHIDQAGDPAAWRALNARRAAAPPSSPPRNVLVQHWQPLLSLVLVLPSLAFLVAGGFPATSWIQRLLSTSFMFAVLTMFAVATLAMVAWGLFNTVRGLPTAFREPYADTAVSAAFRSSVAAGALGVGALSLSKVLTGGGASDPTVSNVHILDAISQMTNILGFGLLALSLLLIFAAFMGGTGGLGGALVGVLVRISLQELLQMIAMAGIGALGALGAMLAMASGGGGSGSGQSSGSSEGKGSGEGSGEGKGSSEGSGEGKGSSEGSGEGKGSSEGSGEGQGQGESSGEGEGKSEPQRELTEDEKWDQATRARDQAAEAQNTTGEVAERYSTPESAIGQVEGEVTVIDKVPTENAGLRSQGYTETWYVEDAEGTQWTVARNPRTGQFTGAHPSSSNF